jgi:hypothetical protein
MERPNFDEIEETRRLAFEGQSEKSRHFADQAYQSMLIAKYPAIYQYVLWLEAQLKAGKGEM